MEKASRIQVRRLPPDCNMEMRSGCTAGTSAETDFLTSFHRISLLHFQFRKMEIERKQALAVIEHNAVSFEIEETSE